jgi:hypothetical protein
VKKLLYAGLGATMALVSASPALAQNVQADMAIAIENRMGLDRSLAEAARLATGPSLDAEVAVLGVQALPVLGFAAPVSVQLDMLTALRGVARESRELGELPSGGSTD